MFFTFQKKNYNIIILGKISGGADQTKGHEYEYMFYVSGFKKNESAALKFEWSLQHPNGLPRGNKRNLGVEGKQCCSATRQRFAAAQ